MFEYMFSYIMLLDLPIIYIIPLDLLLFDTLTSDIWLRIVVFFSISHVSLVSHTLHWWDTNWLSIFLPAPVIEQRLWSCILVSSDTPETMYSWTLVSLVPCSFFLWLYNIIIDNLHWVGRNWWVLISSMFMMALLCHAWSLSFGSSGSHQRFRWGVLAALHPFHVLLPARVCTSSRSIPMRSAILSFSLSCLGDQ